MPYIIAIIIVLIAGITFTLMRPDESAQQPVVQAVVSTPATTTGATTSSMQPYADGSYTTKVTYKTPTRSEYLMDVTLIFKDGIIADSSIAYSQGGEDDPNAQRFDAAYRTELLGKSIDEVKLSRVGGASLTTNAFNEALTAIKADAKS
jgi:hypothetical protein